MKRPPEPVPATRHLSFVLALAFVLTAVAASANTRPPAPRIIEPAESALPLDPGDVHMATAPFIDDDPGDLLACSDWEIRSLDGGLVWFAYCASGVLAVHIHLGDGTFVNTERHLLGSTSYVLNVRFRDSSGDPSTEQSDWSTRNFRTGPASTVYPLEIADVLSSPPPRLHDSSGSSVTLYGGATVALVSERDELLLAFSGNGGDLQITNPLPLLNHALVRALVSSGTEALALPATNIEFADDNGIQRNVYLPAVTLAPGSAIAFWIAQDGSSFEASPGDETPHFSKLARAAETPWTVFERGYRVEHVVSDLQLPVNLAFVPAPLPDADAPLFYVTELYGSIRAVLRDGTMRDYATHLLNFDPTGIFPGSGEHGIAGTVVEPETGDLFVSAVYASESGAHYPKVIRLHSIDGGRTASAVTTILDMQGEEIGPSHQISSLSFGADGKLYVHVGDGFETAIATDRRSFRGKILRVNRDGTPPADNPFYDKSDGISATDYIFAYGFRNPFGGAWRAADASLYVVDNGPQVDRLAKVAAGMNYQWSGSDDDMRVNAAYNWSPSVAPVNIAFIQGATFAGSGFADGKSDHAFVSESGPTWVSGTTPLGKRIREFAFDRSGNVVSSQPFLEYAGTGNATVAALAAGPDGLYFSDLFPEQGSPIDHGANIYRVRYVGRVIIGADVSNPGTKTVRFSSTITVPDYTNLTWDFGDGSTSNAANPEHSFPGNGPYNVKLSVIGAKQLVVDDYTRVQFPRVLGAGLTAIYSDSHGNRLSRIDANVDFDWQIDAAPLPAASLNVTWTGQIAPSVSALYTFSLHTDGNARLRIDDRTIIDTLSPDPTTLTNPIRLEAGRTYSFVLESDATSMDGETRLLWSAQGMPARVVPSTVFYLVNDRRRATGH